MDAQAARQMGSVKGDFDPVPYLRFDDGAAADFLDWRVDMEKRIRSGALSAVLEGHLAKYRKLVPALALMNHVADKGEGRVSRRSLLRALAFAYYLESHAVRIYASGCEVEHAAASAILKHIRADELTSGFTARDIQRHQWSHLTEREHISAGLALLVDLDYLADVRTPSQAAGGRPKLTYEINPRAAA